MNYKFKNVFLAITIFFVSLFSFAFNVAALCPPGVSPCYNCGEYYTRDGVCGATLYKWAVDHCCDNPDYVCGESKGAPWQVADTGAGSHHCSAQCLNPAENLPKNPRWYDDPTKNNDAAADKGNSNDTLPIVLDWELNSWKDGGKYNPDGSARAMAAANYGSNSFYIEIDNPNDQMFEPDKVPNATYNKTTKVLGKCLKNDYFNSVTDGLPCLFRSAKKDITYRVKACCAADCTDCGPFVEWKFSTGDFPEPKSPLDPDWNGPNGLTGVPFKNLQLEWCKTWVTKNSPNDWAKSHELMVTSDEQGIGQQNCHPLLVSNGQCKATAILPNAETALETPFYPIQGRTDLNFFTRNRTYVWKMKTCFDQTSAQCGDYGQSWTFTPKNDPIGIPETTTPKNDSQGETPIGMPVSISWTIPDGANSYAYETSFISGTQNTKWDTVPNNESDANLKDKFDADNLKADTLYKWRVKACAKFNSSDCDGWSAWFYFRTTGRPPKFESMAETATTPKIFSWEAVPGAKSYNFSLTAAENGTETATSTLNDPALLASPKHTVGYPAIDQGKNYTWKVQTCAHSDGKVCGSWSAAKPFAILPLDPVSATSTSPDPDETVYTDSFAKNLSWYAVPGAAAYHYTLSLVSPAEPNCVQELIEKTISRSIDMVELKCLGTYQASVTPCIDSECKSTGPKTEWKFVLAQQIPASRPALAACGMSYDLPETPWSERETCQPKHLLLLGKVAIDFTMFKLSILLLPILILITGLIFYTSLKTPELLDKVKTAWKAVGIGYGILFLAWIIVGFLLQIMGFPGLWWKIL